MHNIFLNYKYIHILLTNVLIYCISSFLHEMIIFIWRKSYKILIKKDILQKKNIGRQKKL